MMRQTYTGPVHWIIVDDGEEAQPITFEREGWTLTIVRPEPFWKPGQNTQARNLLAGIKRVKPSDRLVVIEDDDAYAPNYLETVNRWLDTHDLVGESYARYYNISSRRYQQLRNSSHASLCSTAMKGHALQAFERELNPGVQFIDLNLWRNFKESKALHRSNMVVGIKGQPGRGGIGMGHKPDFAGNQDSNCVILRQWLGINAGFYNV
jgi:hypothetical protein